MSEKQHRKKAREAVLQALYAKHVSSEDAKESPTRHQSIDTNLTSLLIKFVDELI